MLYLPYGEEMARQKVAGWATPYTFTGKEKDDLTGLQYFGARYYDSRISIWYGVDPMAEKYPQYTPFNYTLGNPIRLVDPDGMEVDDIIISHDGKDYKYENGKLYIGGLEYKGKQSGFLMKTVNALNSIGSTAEGGTMLSELQSSSNIFKISKGDSEFKSSEHDKAFANQFWTDPSAKNTYEALTKAGIEISGGSGGSIGWNPSGTTLPTTEGGSTNANIDLAHELFHALDANKGLLDSRKVDGIKRSEWQAVYRENVLRSEMKLPLRTHYIKNIDPMGNFLGGSGPRMLTPSNSPIKPSWYK